MGAGLDAEEFWETGVDEPEAEGPLATDPDRLFGVDDA